MPMVGMIGIAVEDTGDFKANRVQAFFLAKGQTSPAVLCAQQFFEDARAFRLSMEIAMRRMPRCQRVVNGRNGIIGNHGRPLRTVRIAHAAIATRDTLPNLAVRQLHDLRSAARQRGFGE